LVVKTIARHQKKLSPSIFLFLRAIESLRAGLKLFANGFVAISLGKKLHRFYLLNTHPESPPRLLQRA